MLNVIRRLLRGFRRPAATTRHIVLFECPMPGATVSTTPPITIRGERDAIEQFIPLKEFKPLFGGYAMWSAPKHPIPELSGQALGVWSRRTCTRFRRILRARGASVEVRKERGPEQRLSRTVTLLVLALVACGETPRTDAPAAEPFRPGIRFDPATLRSGTSVGTLVVDSVTARTTPVDSTYVGTARFRGEIELSGQTLRHPESDVQAICFEADSLSAARLPRWQGDERRPWFCFTNDAEARRALGPPSEGVGATVVIDRFTIHRGLTDEVNSARLVRAVRQAPRG